MEDLMKQATAIVAAQVGQTSMSIEEVQKAITETYNTLKNLGSGQVVSGEVKEEEKTITKGQITRSIGKKDVTCLECGKKFKTLKRHLKTTHEMTEKEYKEKYGIDKKKSLVAKDYSASRRQMAIDKGLGETLAKARAKKK